MGKSNTTEGLNSKEANKASNIESRKEQSKASDKEPNKKNISVGTPYDDAFRTMVAECSGLLIPIINEVFGKHYSGSERVVFRQNEHFVLIGNREQLKEGVDQIMGGKVLDFKGKEPYQEGKAEGKAEGVDETRLENIKSVMKNLKYTSKQAMELLDIAPADQSKYAAML